MEMVFVLIDIEILSLFCDISFRALSCIKFPSIASGIGIITILFTVCKMHHLPHLINRAVYKVKL